MSLTGAGEIADLLHAAMDKIFPDATKAEEAKSALDQAMQSGELQTVLGQLAINKAEAESTNWWVAGWRPGIGWVGVVSLALIYWPKAIVLSALWTYQAYCAVHAEANPALIVLPAYPDLGLTDLIGLLGTILGTAGLRTMEKRSNTEGNR